jgi:hypothetical protein
MVVKVALWYELWTSLIDLCWIIFLLGDLITEEALIVLHTDEIEEAPNKRNTLASLTEDVILRSSTTSPPAPCFLQMCLSLLENLISDVNNHKKVP